MGAGCARKLAPVRCYMYMAGIRDLISPAPRPPTPVAAICVHTGQALHNGVWRCGSTVEPRKQCQHGAQLHMRRVYCCGERQGCAGLLQDAVLRQMSRWNAYGVHRPNSQGRSRCSASCGVATPPAGEPVSWLMFLRQTASLQGNTGVFTTR